MLKDFRAFIAKGNVLDLAVAVIIGAAFGKIVTSLTDDIIMPIVGKIFGGLDFSSHFSCSGRSPPDYHGSMTRLRSAQEGRCAGLGWGAFVTEVVSFPHTRLHHFPDGALGDEADEETRGGAERPQ